VSIRESLEALVNERRDLTEAEAAAVMQELMSGETTPAQGAAFLVALRLKGETADEITGMARVMREHSLQVEAQGPLLDNCGTGGDGTGVFNVSTTAAFVLAGAGARVAKHGNRAMSSACGSADVLEALGARIDLAPEQVAESIDRTGFGFMFAQAFHPAMKHVGPVRREIGVRTVFNILGPLTNPASATHQVLGVARPELAPVMAEVLGRLGGEHALVVHGHGGVDKLSLSGPNEVHELRAGSVTSYQITAEDVGLDPAPLESVLGGTADENANVVRRILDGEQGPKRDIVTLNAGAGLVAADLAPDLSAGIRRAAESIDSGAAKATLESFVAVTNSFA
jgi:anthranilate phosphoribosyltransferase